MNTGITSLSGSRKTVYLATSARELNEKNEDHTHGQVMEQTYSYVQNAIDPSSPPPTSRRSPDRSFRTVNKLVTRPAIAMSEICADNCLIRPWRSTESEVRSSIPSSTETFT